MKILTRMFNDSPHLAMGQGSMIPYIGFTYSFCFIIRNLKFDENMVSKTDYSGNFIREQTFFKEATLSDVLHASLHFQRFLSQHFPALPIPRLAPVTQALRPRSARAAPGAQQRPWKGKVTVFGLAFKW